MTMDISKYNIILTSPTVETDETLKNTTSAEDTQYFLSITSRFALKEDALLHVEKVDTSDVISGKVSEEIANIEAQQNQINSILQANTSASLNSVLNDDTEVGTGSTNEAGSTGEEEGPSFEEIIAGAKKIEFVEYTGGTQIKANTDTTNILNNIQYANDDEKAVVEGAIDLLVTWLDDYIANYDQKVSEGQKNNESELKLSFLLELRSVIENIDFPIGFGDYSAPEDEYTLGSYSFNMGGYDGYYHLNTNRSILLNAKYLMPERPYSSYDEIIALATANPDLEFYYTDLAFVSDEAYYNYCTNYMASVLVHELTHSMHIYNEAVTYYVNDCFDDDFYNQKLEGVDQDFLNENFRGISITYGDLGISNNLYTFEDAVNHGHENNLDYEDLYVNMGFTISDDRNELLNFAYYV